LKAMSTKDLDIFKDDSDEDHPAVAKAKQLLLKKPTVKVDIFKEDSSDDEGDDKKIIK
jgi:hypothetical protein